MSDSQAITSVDIKLMASERMHDEDDGGGRMSGNEIIDGQSNNMFPDVSELDRTYGRINLRKTFPAVMSHDTDTYYGAHIMVAEPPTDEAVHVTVFQTTITNDAWTDERLDAQTKIESYVTLGQLSPMRLAGDCWEGARAIKTYYRKEAKAPVVGEIYVLKEVNTGIVEFIRVMRVTISDVTYTVEDSHGLRSFDRKEAVIDISDPLIHSFPAGHVSDLDTYHPPTQVYNANAIPSVKYYSIKPIANAIAQGDRTLKVEDYKGHLLPATQAEEALVDIMAGTVRPFEVNAGTRTVTMTPIVNTSSIYIVDDTVRRLTYTGMALSPKPEKLTFVAAYRSQDKWYFIQDLDGTGQLTGDGAGTINYTTGSYSLTLKDYPDLQSSIICGWGSVQETEQILGADIEYPKYVKRLLNTPVKLGSVSITWTADGEEKTATDDYGVIVGDASGYIVYSDGTLEFQPSSLPDPNTYITVDYVKHVVVTENFTDVPRDDITNGFEVELAQQPIPETMKVETMIEFRRGVILENETPLSIPYYWWDYNWRWGYYSYYRPQYLNKMSYSTIEGFGSVSSKYDVGYYKTDTEGYKYFVIPHFLVGTPSHDGKLPFGKVDVDTKKLQLFDRYKMQYRYRYSTYERVRSICGCRWRRIYHWATRQDDVKVENNTTDVKVTYTPVGEQETAVSEQIEVGNVQIDITSNTPKDVVPNSVAFTFGGHTYFDWEGEMYRDPDSNWVGTRCGTIDYHTGRVELDWWVGGSPGIDITSLLVIADPYLANAIDSYSTLAPLRPQSFQIAATSLSGDLLTGSADENGVISGNGIFGEIDITTGTFSVRFGEYVNPDDLTPEEKAQEWFDEDWIEDDGRILRPFSVFPETIRYNCVAYVYMPLSEDILGLSPVRLPPDGKVPVFQVGDIIVVHNTKKTVIDTPTDGQVVDLGRVRLSWVKIYDVNENKVDTSLYTPDLDAGTVTLDNMSGVAAPITIYDRIEDMALVSDLMIDGTLTVTKTFSHNFPLGSYASSALILKDMFAHVSNVFEQKTWTGEWSDDLIGDQPIARYNDTIYPIEITNDGATQERWALIFTSSTSFKVVGEFSGQIAVGDVNSDCSPMNPATGHPYFTVRAPGWGSGWVHDNVLRFNTIAANKPVWVARTILQSEEATGSDKFCIEIRGDVNTD